MNARIWGSPRYGWIGAPDRGAFHGWQPTTAATRDHGYRRRLSVDVRADGGLGHKAMRALLTMTGNVPRRV